MNLTTFFVSAALSTSALACGDYGLDLTDLYVQAAFSDSEEDAAAAIIDLRGLGEDGLSALLAADDALKQHPDYSAVVDQVAKQRDALRSRLFWHTDFDRAKANAVETDRPILSLRLLGQLDEEFSCANSRLFREVLYSEPEVADYLREHFVLHWESVRPVPVMTIDFGDGRVLKRTITGNSAHYVLDAEGKVVDALPGLYSVELFLEKLCAAEALEKTLRREHGWARLAVYMSYHLEAEAALAAEFSERLEKAGMAHKVDALSDPIEVADLSAEEWSMLVAADRMPQELDLVAIKANMVTFGKGLMETALIAEVREAELAEKKRDDLVRTAAEDSVRNEFVLHRRIHARLAQRSGDVDALNDWVYAELFKMPASDEWLGLHTPEVFTGLDDNGIVSID